MLPFIFQNKGSLANVQSPAVASAVAFYVGLINKGLAATPDKLGAGWCGEALGKRKAAITFEGNWVMPFMKTTRTRKIRYGVFPMVKNKTGGNLAFTVSYSIAKDSKNKQAAWTLLSVADGQAGQKLWVSKGLALPSRSDVKAIGGRRTSSPGDVRPRLGLRQLPNTYTVMNNDLQGSDQRQQVGREMLSEVDAEP